jgi:membrane associated rhomboid family serine protease
MGIHSRDYIRESHPGGGFGGASDLWAIKYLLIANIAVFLLQVFTKDELIWARFRVVHGGLTEWLALNAGNLYPQFQLWRLVTYGFCHSTLMHIAFNLFILWMFGRTIEPIYGSREFLSFFLVGVVISGLGHVAFQLVTGHQAGVVGASGGVMAVVFLTAMHYPRMTVLLFFVIPMQLRWLAVLYAVADVFGAFNPQSGVAHVAHLGGAAFGILYFKLNLRIDRFWTRFRLPRFDRTFGSRRKVRLHQPPPSEEPEPRDDFNERVDAILKKISEQGEASLTDEERDLLKTASRRYRRR